MKPATTPEARTALARLGTGLLLLATVAAVYQGWRVFWFLTDDAYIAFRYVQNSVAGFGYVFNPPPFAPVEGYTSFLWVVILDGVWRLTGVAPPDSANWISLGFGYATLGIVLLFVRRMKLPAPMPSNHTGRR